MVVESVSDSPVFFALPPFAVCAAFPVLPSVSVAPTVPQKAATRRASIVADMMITNKSSRSCIASFKNASAKSAFIDLS